MVLSCRLCLTENPEEKLKNVYQCRVKHSQDSLVDVLFWVFSVEVEVTDSFSKNICSKCIQLIEYILKVKNTFQKNQKSLRNHQHNPNYDSLDVQTLHDDTFKKVSNNGKRLSFCSTTPNGPHKSRYDSTNIYDRSSPRLRVSLSHIEILRPMRINLVPLENTQEYLKYRRLKNGSFKKRKFRHFNLDGALLDDICNTLKENKRDKTGPLKKDIGVSTEYTLLSKATNTESKLCTWTRNTASLKNFMVDTPSKNFIINDKRKKRCDDTQDDDILDIIDVSKNINFDETMTFKKDASTNTETTKPNTRNIGINATETFTKQFKRNDDLIKVNIESLVNFAPKVVLTPLEDILKDANYTQIDNFRYIKNDEPSSDSKTEEVLEQNDESSSDSNTEEVLEQNDECNIDENRQHAATNKKQRFLDYYKNFSSFAVRELIAGKKIRETYSETSAVYKIANVCSVFVCDFCSRSFLSKISLDFHYKKGHKSKKRLNGVEVDLEDSTSKVSIRHKKKLKTIEERQGKPADERSEVVKEDNVAKISCTTAAKRKTKSHNNENGESKLTCLRKKAQKINYNINYIIKHKTRAKQIPLKVKGKRGRKKKFKQLGNPPLKVKGKRGRKKKFKQLGNPVLCHEERKTISYAWDRNGLGKYSAISYYANFSTDDTDPHLDLIDRSIEHKPDLALNDTIHKLANRLDRSDVEIDVCN